MQGWGALSRAQQPVSLDCGILGRMVSPASLAWSFMPVCLLGREPFPGRPRPGPDSSQAMGDPGMNEDNENRTPLGFFQPGLLA